MFKMESMKTKMRGKIRTRGKMTENRTAKKNPFLEHKTWLLKRHMHECYCILTKAIPIDPVMAEDGCIYEREAIKKWLDRKHVSPHDHQPMCATFESVYYTF